LRVSLLKNFGEERKTEEVREEERKETASVKKLRERERERERERDRERGISKMQPGLEFPYRYHERGCALVGKSLYQQATEAFSKTVADYHCAYLISQNWFSQEISLAIFHFVAFVKDFRKDMLNFHLHKKNKQASSD